MALEDDDGEQDMKEDIDIKQEIKQVRVTVKSRIIYLKLSVFVMNEIYLRMPVAGVHFVTRFCVYCNVFRYCYGYYAKSLSSLVQSDKIIFIYKYHGL